MNGIATGYLQRHQLRFGVTLVALLVGAAIALAISSAVARRFGAMGVEHILTGYDHLAFLVMLMVATRSFKDLFWIATTFTLAHSVTLTAASLGWVTVSASWVEPAIALTILYVAIENLVTAAPRARLLLTFGFGLIHGLGFASVLTDGPLPASAEIVALVSFNLGVEIGQMSFLALTYPLWHLAQKFHAQRMRQALALIVIGLCVYWLLERLA